MLEELYKIARQIYLGKKCKVLKLDLVEVANIEAVALYFAGFNKNHPYLLASKYLFLLWKSGLTRKVVIEKDILKYSIESIDKYMDLILEASDNSMCERHLNYLTDTYDEFMKIRTKLI